MQNKRGMTWGKMVLLFQAVITLLLGIVFFLQLTQLDRHGVQELKVMFQEVADSGDETAKEYINLSQRYEVAGYVLLVVSIVEINFSIWSTL